MLGVLAEQRLVEEFRNDPKFQESLCTATEQQAQCIRCAKDYKVS